MEEKKDLVAVLYSEPFSSGGQARWVLTVGEAKDPAAGTEYGRQKLISLSNGCAPSLRDRVDALNEMGLKPVGSSWEWTEFSSAEYRPVELLARMDVVLITGAEGIGNVES